MFLCFLSISLVIGILSLLFSLDNGYFNFHDPLNIFLILSFLSLWITIMFAIISWKEVFGFFIVDDEGMRFTRFGKTKKCISWNEVKEIALIYPPKKFVDKMKEKIRYHEFYIVFLTNEGNLFENVDKNYKHNFCFIRPNKRIYGLLQPHLHRFSEEHRNLVIKFFNRKQKENGTIPHDS